MSAETAGWPWDVLGLTAPAGDARSVRRAYATRLKSLAAEDVAGFEALRQAYDFALSGCEEGRGPRRAVLMPQPPLAPEAVSPSMLQAAPDSASADVAEADALPGIADGACQAAERGLMLERVGALLSAQVFTRSDWEGLLASPLLDDPEFSRQVQSVLVHHIGTPDRRVPPARWILMVDERFGWRADGVGFRRKFAMSERAQERILAAHGGPQTPTATEVKSGSGTQTFWFFLALLVLSSIVRVLIP